MIKKKKRGTIQLVESIKNPELESSFIKYPRKEAMYTAGQRARDFLKPSPFRLLLAKFRGGLNRKYTDIHTHPDFNPLPSGSDIYKFLATDDIKTMAIASTDSSTGEVKSAFILKKTKKTPKISPQERGNFNIHLMRNYDYGLLDYDHHLTRLEGIIEKYHLQKRLISVSEYKHRQKLRSHNSKDREKNLEGRTIIFIFSTLGGIFLSAFSIKSTGYVIEALTTTTRGLVGLILFTVGVTGLFFERRKSNQF